MAVLCPPDDEMRDGNFPAGYPTRAREDVDTREVVAIGSIETRTNRIDITPGPSELRWWIEPADILDLGLIEQAR